MIFEMCDDSNGIIGKFFCYDTQAYYHGVRYLKKLDKLVETISVWKVFNHHDFFKEQINQAHSRKRSFWSKYYSKK